MPEEVPETQQGQCVCLGHDGQGHPKELWCGDGLPAVLKMEVGMTPAQYVTSSLVPSTKWLVGGSPCRAGAGVLAWLPAESLLWLWAVAALGSPGPGGGCIVLVVLLSKSQGLRCRAWLCLCPSPGGKVSVSHPANYFPAGFSHVPPKL